jgi:hypothetical protein
MAKLLKHLSQLSILSCGFLYAQSETLIFGEQLVGRPAPNQFVIIGEQVPTNKIQVFRNGILQRYASDYYIEPGNILTFYASDFKPNDRIIINVIRPLKPSVGLGFTPGDGLNLSTQDGIAVLNVNPNLLKHNSFVSSIYDFPLKTVFIYGTFHNISDPQEGCPLIVYAYEKIQEGSKIKYKNLEFDSFSIDPSTCDIEINFASEQTNFYIAILGGH